MIVELTVTVHVAVLPPSAVVAVTVAVPGERAVTRPPEETDATEPLDEDHVTFRFVAFEGETVAASCEVALTSSDRLVAFKLTPVTGTFAGAHVAVTVTLLAGMVKVLPKDFVPDQAELVKPLNVYPLLVAEPGSVIVVPDV
jgi:hypothetical protein